MLFDIPNNELFDIPGNMFTDKNLESPQDGLKKGNMFSYEYVPYKKYTCFDIRPDSEKSAMLLEIMSYSFAINDLNLYLDLHEDDNEMYRLFKLYVKKEMDLEEEYVKKYGPLCIKDVGSKFDWVSKKWAWDNGGVDYV